MKSVLSAGLEFVRVGFIIFLHRLFRAGNIWVDGWIFFTVVGEHRGLNVFHYLERLRTVSVENHTSPRAATLRCRRECHFAAPTKTDEPRPIHPNIRKSSE